MALGKVDFLGCLNGSPSSNYPTYSLDERCFSSSHGEKTTITTIRGFRRVPLSDGTTR